MPRTSGRPTRGRRGRRPGGSPRTASRPMSAMPKVLSARCRPRSRTAGRATITPRAAATSAAEQHAEHAVAAEGLAGDEGADADEEVLRQRDLARQPGEGDEGQGDGRDHEGRGPRGRAWSAGPHVARATTTTATSAAPATSDRRSVGTAGWSRPDDAAGRQAERRDEQHGEDEEQAGDGEAQPEEHVAVGPQPR